MNQNVTAKREMDLLLKKIRVGGGGHDVPDIGRLLDYFSYIPELDDPSKSLRQSVAKAHEALDKNGDGRVHLDEYLAHLDKLETQHLIDTIEGTSVNSRDQRVHDAANSRLAELAER